MLRLAAVGFRHGHNWTLVDGLVKTGEAEVVAVAEDAEALAAEAVERYRVPVYPTVEALLDATDVDVASLAPTNNAKADAVCALVARGVHCFVDKPLTTTLDDLGRIEAAVREAGVVCVMALPVRFFPPHWTAKRLIDERAIGAIATAYAIRSHNLHPHRRNPWELNLQENGGPLVDLGSHDYDYLDWCVGSEPVSVFGHQALRRYTDLPTFADAAQMLVRFANGASACVSADWLAPDDARASATGVHLVGTQGTMRIIEGEGELWRLGPASGWEQVPIDEDRPDIHTDFLAAVRGEPHVVRTEECLAVARVLLEGRRSAETGTAVTLASRGVTGL